MENQEKTFYVASVTANLKEKALKAAIDWYFKGGRWDESVLEEYAGINVDPDGTETFYIGDTQLIRFGPLESKIDIEDERVMLLFSQPILELY